MFVIIKMKSTSTYNNFSNFNFFNDYWKERLILLLIILQKPFKF